ncbi:MAG TPA: hypothetical protein VN715_04775 [Roseiarcus sp.]|nr:hypothetical protein [Roseiarcus sp.]
MVDVSDGWNSLPLLQPALTGVGMIFSFVVGAWTRGASAGKSEGGLDARLAAVAERVTRLEQRHDNVDDKIGVMAERIAQMPTRTEVAQGFDRLEGRFDMLMRAREG